MNNNYPFNSNNRNHPQGVPPKRLSFCDCRKNTIKSVYDVEHFLCNLKDFHKCMHLFKFFR